MAAHPARDGRLPDPIEKLLEDTLHVAATPARREFDALHVIVDRAIEKPLLIFTTQHSQSARQQLGFPRGDRRVVIVQRR